MFYIKLELCNLWHWVPWVMVKSLPSFILFVLFLQIEFYCVITSCNRLHIKIYIIKLFSSLDVVKVYYWEKVHQYCNTSYKQPIYLSPSFITIQFTCILHEYDSLLTTIWVSCWSNIISVFNFNMTTIPSIFMIIFMGLFHVTIHYLLFHVW